MRPIINSDSSTTLADLIDDQSKVGTEHQHHVLELILVQTNILLPNGDDDQFLHLPSSSVPFSDTSTTSAVPVDKYLSTIPTIFQKAEKFLHKPPVVLTCEKNSCTCRSSFNENGIEKRHLINKRVLSICQGEVAHAVPSQCDVIASDNATTCHIIAVRSTLGMNRNNTQPITSLAHIDRAGYEQCIKDMIITHKHHHLGKKKLRNIFRKEVVHMDLHVMGGFDDADGSSREISEFLMKLLARIAREECDWLCMTLRTCAISSMNDDGFHHPIGRGFGVNLTSGECFLATVDRSVAGPALILRSCRLWSGVAGKKLNIVHTVNEKNVKLGSTITVDPFKFKAVRGMDILLRLSDKMLLEHTSTSPQAEREDFCDNVRGTLRFMKDTDWRYIFGHRCDRPVTFRRANSSTGNDWQQN